MSRIRADRYTNRLGTGAPTFSNGVNIIGNVGVGTTVPTSSLTVKGDMNVTGTVSVGGTLSYEDVTSIDSVGVITARSGIHVTSGKVGIGTNDPLRQLDIFSTGHATAAIKGDTQSSLFFVDSGDSNIGQISYIHADNYMYFRVNDAERLRITGIGSLGVGTQTPKTDLDISQKTGAVALPQGTTAQRPSGSAPYIRKNTTNNALEYFDGTSWVEIITDYFPTGSTILG